MKPAKFEYHKPETLDEALTLLAEYGDEARVIAGGQSLVPMMNIRLARPDHLIDINGIDDLSQIRLENGSVAIGALVRHREIEHSAQLAQACPPLPAAACNIGHYALRARGTIGGSLALADPAAEFPLMATLLDAEFVARSGAGERSVPSHEFFVSVFTTALEPEEILTAVRFRTLAQSEGWGFRWFSRRVGDYALVNAAAIVALKDEGRIHRIAMVLGGVGATPVRLTGLEQESVGAEASAGWVREISSAAAARVEPGGDKHASAEYRRELVELLLAGALEDAIDRCRGRQAA
ncbi:MAG: xanthine dehydrogenase family protein subunit M [Rhodospirillales bacterium]|nr:MAG: xanthine dehydrogenase family protein subunit M [Rhodospirillales bacterium]